MESTDTARTCDVVAHGAELGGADPGESLGEEEQDHVGAAVIAQRNLLFFAVVEGEVGSLVASFKCHGFTF
jgi:hypothetical protein